MALRSGGAEGASDGEAEAVETRDDEGGASAADEVGGSVKVLAEQLEDFGQRLRFDVLKRGRFHTFIFLWQRRDKTAAELIKPRLRTTSLQ